MYSVVQFLSMYFCRFLGKCCLLIYLFSSPPVFKRSTRKVFSSPACEREENACVMLHKLQLPIETGFWSTLKQDRLLVLEHYFAYFNTAISECGEKGNVLNCLAAPWELHSVTCWLAILFIEFYWFLWCCMLSERCTKTVGPIGTL